jgi:hypothetical protein
MGIAAVGEVSAMKLFQLCYAALGFAVARWIFKRESMVVIAPVVRFRRK